MAPLITLLLLALPARAAEGPVVHAASPAVAPNDAPQTVTLYGRNLPPGGTATLALRGEQGRVEVALPLQPAGPEAVSFELPAWQGPGRHAVRLDWPDGARACVPGGIEIVARPCAVSELALGQMATAPDATQQARLQADATCLVAHGASRIVALASSAAGEGLGAMRAPALDGRELVLAYQPDLALARAEAAAAVVSAALPPGAAVPVLGVALPRPLPPVDPHVGALWEHTPSVRLVGQWPAGEGPLRCPVDPPTAVAEATVRCVADAAVQALVVAAPGRVHDPLDPDPRSAWDEPVQAALQPWADTPLPVVVAALPDGHGAIELIAVPSAPLDRVSGRYPVEGCGLDDPSPGRSFAYGYGEQGGWTWGLRSATRLRSGDVSPGTWSLAQVSSARLGVQGGVFAALGVELPLAGPLTVDLQPTLGTELPLASAAIPPSLWAGLRDRASSLAVGADLPFVHVLRDHLLVELGLHAGVGLSPAAGWQAGGALGVGWRGTRPWARSP